MKLKPFWLLCIEAGRHGIQAWRLWEAQGGMHDSLHGLHETRLASLAKDRAEECRMLAGLFSALDAVFPLGLTGPARKTS